LHLEVGFTHLELCEPSGPFEIAIGDAKWQKFYVYGKFRRKWTQNETQTLYDAHGRNTGYGACATSPGSVKFY